MYIPAIRLPLVYKHLIGFFARVAADWQLLGKGERMLQLS